ncbi:2OG-Fe(II) oxygenase [Kordiimonas sp. SCSIO 12610]|uniref:2OG-Fe(II) oxygenase n=1 Tax=Kordiimonas sp. SCSIO 12610 TaxID=2829597 RepID=UPI00210CA448|nr:2OG-Fe(II) oxygenase [Kordiimonas sp. SCSIO 12610]UTW53818.1 2OG-Fe(II) oxygenase [Kordiimonas sp. SCSIO 12610]
MKSRKRFRYYRYRKGQQFDWHMDGAFMRPNGERSLFTLMFYLNDGFEGGDITFCDWGSPLLFDDFAITPQAGKALLFFHPISHKGEPVISGEKFVLRTDVMYSAKAGSQDPWHRAR